MHLTSSQRAALNHVRERVQATRVVARSRINESLRRAGCDNARYDGALAVVRHHARVIVHFHPDRLDVKQRPVAAALLDEGMYRNQFDTGISTGGLLPYPGSARDTWEHALFGGAYHVEGTSLTERPKYGALELVRFSDGPIPRFGSCYLVLRPGVANRTSFTFAGSEDPRAPERLGTIEVLDAVMAALFAEIEAGAVATPPWPPFRAPTLGVRNLTIASLLERVKQLADPRPDPGDLIAGRVLDTQIEAQVHGPIDLHEDVELLVADPAFKGNATGDLLRQVASRCRIPVGWHQGFRLHVADVPPDFRGPEMPRLARRIAGDDGVIDAAVIGAAEASLHRQPESWRDCGSHTEVLQHLKQLWHVLVHYGGPAQR